MFPRIWLSNNVSQTCSVDAWLACPIDAVWAVGSSIFNSRLKAFKTQFKNECSMARYHRNNDCHHNDMSPGVHILMKDLSMAIFTTIGEVCK